MKDFLKSAYKTAPTPDLICRNCEKNTITNPITWCDECKKTLPNPKIKGKISIAQMQDKLRGWADESRLEKEAYGNVYRTMTSSD